MARIWIKEITLFRDKIASEIQTFFSIKIDGNKTDNVAFFLYSDLERGGASITCYSTDTNKSKEVVKD